MGLVNIIQQLLVLLFVLSCTGQKPAPIRHTTNYYSPIKESCSDLKLEGTILSKENVLNVFDCTGWSKTYPKLFNKIKTANASQVDQVFAVFNSNLFTTKEQRKATFQYVIDSEANQSLTNVSYFLERSLGNHKLLNQLDLVLNDQKISKEQKSTFMKILSSDNVENVKHLKSLQNIAMVFEKYKSDLKQSLHAESENDFKDKLVVLLDDLASNISKKDWEHLSRLVMSNGKSVLNTWTSDGKDEDLTTTLSVIKSSKFESDVRYLNSHLELGVQCENLSGRNDFQVNLKQELKHKIESLKNDSLDDFEKTLLHGFTKFVAFQDFCQEKKYKQGLDSFQRVLDYCFQIIPVQHDFNFLKDIHVLLGEDRFKILGFLSSDTFSELRKLFIKIDEDDNFVRILFHLMSEISNEDLQNIAELLSEVGDSQTQLSAWHESWGLIWINLDHNQKKEFVELLSITSETEFRSDLALKAMVDLFQISPNLSSEMANSLSQTNYQNDLRYIVELLSDEDIRSDLSGFFSEKGLFEFLKILSFTKETAEVKPKRDSTRVLNQTYVGNPVLTKDSKVRTCYAELSSRYKVNPSYYSLVVELPEICKNTLGSAGFVGQIYLWMNSSHSYFNERYGVNDFHSGTGIWSPGMLHFIFSAAIRADHALVDQAGRQGLKLNLDKIHQEITRLEILESFHLFSELYATSITVVPYESKIERYLNNISNDKKLKLTNDFFDLLAPVEVDKFIYDSKTLSCTQILSNLGVNPCLTKEVLKQEVGELLRIAKRRFGSNPTLLEEIIKWLHPEGGIDLPFGIQSSRKHHTSFEEIIRMLHDLSSDKTVKEFWYQTPNSWEEVKGDGLSRLEIVIRDISFNNNFYGAYFMNEVAGAVNYRGKVSGSKKLLNWLTRLSGPLRSAGSMDRNSKWRLQNVKSTYSSLVEVSDEYIQADGSVRSYNEFIQSLLAAIAVSSKSSTQNFNAYRLPNDSMVEGHNGIFLTKIVQMSGLRHMSQFVRSRFTDLSVLKKNDFQSVNNNLVGRYKLKVLQDNFQRVFDKYFDADRNQLNLVFNDLIDFVSELNPQEQKYVEGIIVKVAVLLSSDQLKTETLNELSRVIELLIKYWPEIRSLLMQIDHKESFLKILNDGLAQMVERPIIVQTLMNELLSSKFLSLDDVEKFLQSEQLRNELAGFINQLCKMKDLKFELNWLTTMKSILGNQDLNYEPLVQWLEKSLGAEKKPYNLSVSVLLSFLGEKEGQNYRLKTVLDEFFINHRSQLELFISETFPALEIKN